MDPPCRSEPAWSQQGNSCGRPVIIGAAEDDLCMSHRRDEDFAQHQFVHIYTATQATALPTSRQPNKYHHPHQHQFLSSTESIGISSSIIILLLRMIPHVANTLFCRMHLHWIGPFSQLLCSEARERNIVTSSSIDRLNYQEGKSTRRSARTRTRGG